MVLQGWKAKVVVWCFKFLVFLYDIISLPIYFFIDKPWIKWRKSRIVWSKLEDESDPYSCYVRQIHHYMPEPNGIQTMDKLFEDSVKRFGPKNCFGVREVLGEEEEKVKSGKVFKKLSLGDYKWFTFNEVNERVGNVGRGLLSVGVKSKVPVVLLAETRMEWIITAQACFRLNVPVVTMYATLGEEGLAHGLQETDVTHIITSTETLSKLKNVLNRVPAITHVIYMEGVTKPATEDIPKGVKLIPFSEMEENGKTFTDVSYTPPVPDDLAILMYTSGSTGVPKGVMITHKNVLSSVKGFDDVLQNSSLQMTDNDKYIAYLPAAHVMELASECCLLSLGVQVGFSSPQTLTDFSTAIKKGEKGDLTVLKPTLMVSVPLMLDRIRKSILDMAGKEGTISRLMFDFAISYKKFWSEKGIQTPLLHRKLLHTYKDFMGGNLRMMMCGSAPLSPETQSFIRCCLDVQVLQGYGLTETAASATVMDYDDCSTGRVGAPLSTCKVRLVDWDEGQYHVTDKPNPRGEIVIGGDCLTLGYFKKPEETKDAFKIEGCERWFYSGDIGELFPDGTFKIIDRKKDLIKLQFGEYIALGKVESELKTCPVVENICVLGNGYTTYLVALIVPNQVHLKTIAKEFGKENLSVKEMCADSEITSKFEKVLREHAKKCNLFGSEIPKKVKLCSDEWTPESGLLTAAFKLRRKYIEKHYQDVFDSMYADKVQNGQPSR